MSHILGIVAQNKQTNKTPVGEETARVSQGKGSGTQMNTVLVSQETVLLDKLHLDHESGYKEEAEFLKIEYGFSNVNPTDVYINYSNS